MNRRSVHLIPLLLCASLTACGDEAEARRADGVTFDTTASGTVIVRSPAEGVWEEGEAWRLVEELRIGAVDGGGPEMFGEISALAVDPLGRIWVVERQAAEIRVFDAEGRHVRTVGGKGGGPGEYQEPDELLRAPDGKLWVVDQRQARFTVLDTTGALVETRPRLSPSSSFPWTGGMDREGRLYDIARAEDGEVRLARLDRAGEPETFVRLPESELQVFTHRTEHGSHSITVPFAPAQGWTLSPDGSVWIGYGDDYRIARTTFDGDTLRVVEREWEPIPVTAAEKDESMKRFERFVQRGGRVDPSRIPDVKPAFGSLRGDEDGYLWVWPAREADAEGTALDVFDPEGRYLGRITTDEVISPNRPFVVHGGHLYTVVRDEMDVPYVVRYRIEGKDAAT